MAVAGLGTGLAVTPLTQLALDQVPTERSGMASGVLQTSRPVGVTIGVTALGLAVPGAWTWPPFAQPPWSPQALPRWPPSSRR